MINPITDLSEFVKSIGKAYVYEGDYTTAGGLTLLGATEGEISVEETFQYNDLKAPEWTGDAIHDRWVDGQDIAITVPLIWGNEDLYDRVHPLADKGGGRSKPTKVVSTSFFIISINEVPDGGLGYDGAAWTPVGSDPLHAVLLTRATIEPGRFAFRHADGGKVIREVTLRPMFDDAQPEGKKLYVMGNPVTEGITNFRL